MTSSGRCKQVETTPVVQLVFYVTFGLTCVWEGLQLTSFWFLKSLYPSFRLHECFNVKTTLTLIVAFVALWFYFKWQKVGNGMVIAPIPVIREGDSHWIHNWDPDPKKKKWYKGTVIYVDAKTFHVEIDCTEPTPQDVGIKPVTVKTLPIAIHPAALAKLASDTLYCIDFRNISLDFFVRHPSQNPLPANDGRNMLARRCNPGDIDWFLSHSWQDDPHTKWMVVQREAAKFLSKNGRWPVVWFDGACLNGRPAQLQCMPYYLRACTEFFLLCGETYLSRLWCIWELHTFLSLSGGSKRVLIRELAATESREEAGHVDLSSVKEQIKKFDLAVDTSCYDPNEKATLLASMQAQRAGHDAFNKKVRGLVNFLSTDATNVYI